MVLDPNLAEHLAHFGIDMLKMQKVSFGGVGVSSIGPHWERNIFTGSQLSVAV